MALWSCPTCSKAFGRKGDLTRHKLIHTGIKPHVCNFCGRGFSQFSGLKTHLNVHTGAKPYACGVGTCTKTFGDPSSRTRHRKETHSREGAYKCVIPDCGTRIKRRSAFVAHLRKHGLDPNSINLDAIAEKGKNRFVSPAHVASFEVEHESHEKIESRSISPSSLDDGSRYCVLGEGSETSCFTNNGESSGDDTFDCGRTNWSLANNTFYLDSVFDQTMDSSLSGHPNDIYSYLSSNFENSFRFDGVLSPPVDHPPVLALPSDLGTLQLFQFSETGSDGSQSLWSSPSSTYSVLYTTNLDDDVLSLSLTDNVSQELFL